MIDYVKELDGLKYIVNGFSESEKPEIQIEYCNVNSDTWTLARPKTDEVRKLVKFSQEIVDMFGPDALKITVFINGRSKLNKIVKVTDTHIPLAESAINEKAKKEEEKEFFSGLGEVERVKDKCENEIRFIQLRHENDLRRYQDKIERLEEKLKSVENESAEFATEIEDLEKEIAHLQELVRKNNQEQSKLIALGGVRVLGKVFGMQQDEISELSGFIMRGDEEPEKLQTQDKGGFEFDDDSGIDEQRKAKQTSIISWMKSLDEENFESFFNFMMTITNVPNAFSVAVKAVNQFTEPNNKEDNDE